jgi:hypothetical protein
MILQQAKETLQKPKIASLFQNKITTKTTTTLFNVVSLNETRQLY